MTNAYVYKITNKINKNFYIGYRCGNQRLHKTPEEDLWKLYFTSSKRVKKEIHEFGKENFDYEILFQSNDPIECWKKEQILIQENWKTPGILNGKYHSPESNAEVYRRVNAVSEDSKAKMSASAKGKPKSEEHKRKIALSNTGQFQSEQKRKKISDSKKGKTPHNKGVSPPKFTCQHCGKEASRANLNKWHGDRCKLINPELFNVVAEQVRNINKK